MHDIHLHARGPYRIVLIPGDARPRPYVVLDTAGAWLHEDASFDGARAWLDLRIAQPLPAPTPSRTGARR